MAELVNGKLSRPISYFTSSIIKEDCVASLVAASGLHVPCVSLYISLFFCLFAYLSLCGFSLYIIGEIIFKEFMLPASHELIHLVMFFLFFVFFYPTVRNHGDNCIVRIRISPFWHHLWLYNTNNYK